MLALTTNTRKYINSIYVQTHSSICDDEFLAIETSINIVFVCQVYCNFRKQNFVYILGETEGSSVYGRRDLYIKKGKVYLGKLESVYRIGTLITKRKKLAFLIYYVE